MPNNEYKYDEFIYFVEEPTDEFEEVAVKGGKTRLRRKTTIREIPYEDIDSLDLEKRGEQVPFVHKHVINTPLYMLYYWSSIMGAEPCWLYLELLTYCRDDRDFLWDKLKEIEEKMKCTRPTLNKHLQTLEDYNFIIRVRRFNKKNSNSETTPIIKVRQSVPLLSKDQYRMLSKRNQEQHDKFMEKYGKHSNMEEFHYDAKATKEELLKSSTIRATKKMHNKVDNLIKEDKAITYILTKLSFAEEAKQSEFHELVELRISKPAREKIYEESVVFYDEANGRVDVVLTDEGKLVVDFSTEQQIKNLTPVFEELYEIEDFEIRFYSYEDYMLKLERGL